MSPLRSNVEVLGFIFVVDTNHSGELLLLNQPHNIDMNLVPPNYLFMYCWIQVVQIILEFLHPYK